LGLPNIQVNEHQVEIRDALADEIESFIQCVKTRKEPVVTGADGLKALQLAQDIRAAVYTSAQKAGLLCPVG
jgi:predicted dehydrogenase